MSIECLSKCRHYTTVFNAFGSIFSHKFHSIDKGHTQYISCAKFNKTNNIDRKLNGPKTNTVTIKQLIFKLGFKLAGLAKI